MAAYENRMKNLQAKGQPIPADSQPPSDLRPGPVADKNRPGCCYASVIKPLRGLAVAGAVFHQGFNNCFNGSAGARMYYQVFGKMIAAWRENVRRSADAVLHHLALHRRRAADAGEFPRADV